jgi:hypothetical protein
MAQSATVREQTASIIMSDNEGTGCVCNACCCCYDVCDFDNIIFLMVGGGDCMCIRQHCCLAVGAKPRGVGLVTSEPDECCMLGCYCCDIGLITPSSLCRSTQQCLCCKSTAALPCHEDVLPKCICACYGIQCAPECGCCKKPPADNMLKAMMDRE